MNKIGRRIYFEVETGNVILDKGEMMGSVVETTIEQDIESFKILNERVRESFDYIQLPFGVSFDGVTSYRVNPTTKELEFDYEPTFDLEEYKAFKLQELTRKCSESILGRFTSTITNTDGSTITLQFSNDAEAQSNFKDGIWALETGKVASVSWTAYDEAGKVVRINLDLAQLENVNVDRLTHQQTNISKLRDILQPQLEACTTKEEAEAIVW